MRLLSITLALASLTLTACGGKTIAFSECQKAVERWSADSNARATEPEQDACKAAAEAGSVDAMLTLGTELMKGTHMTKDEAQGFALFLNAAKRGSVNGAYNVALSYARGQGVTASNESALQWFMNAARKGDSGAALALGIMYLNGEGTPKDAMRAYAWFDAAVRGGYADAREYRDQLASSFSADDKKKAEEAAAQLQSALASENDSASQPNETNSPLL